MCVCVCTRMFNENLHIVSYVCGKNGKTSVSLDILQKKRNFFLQNKLMKQPSRELTFALVEIRIVYLFLFQVILSFHLFYVYLQLSYSFIQIL